MQVFHDQTGVAEVVHNPRSLETVARHEDSLSQTGSDDFPLAPGVRGKVAYGNSTAFDDSNAPVTSPRPSPSGRGRDSYTPHFCSGTLERHQSALLIIFTLLIVGLTGCSTGSSGPPIPLTGDPLVDGQAYIASGPKKDRVLWEYRTGLAAMHRSDFTLAREMFEDAILSLGAMMTPDSESRKSRSYFHEEAKKTFYGEPYERVMAWYYRGILYWMAGEPDNARACFRSAQFQDSDAENNEFRSDYVILDYLEGYVTHILGGDGSDALKRAEALAKVKLPPYSREANVVLFIDLGKGPQKYAAGEYGEQLRFRPGNSPVKSAHLKFSGQELKIAPTDDLYFQATTRGGRVMDHVLGNKAVFKKTTDTVGTAAIIAGSAMTWNEDTRDAGWAILAAGVVSKMFAAATRPDADTRTWQNLPQYLSFAMLQLPPGEHELTIEFLSSQGTVIQQLTKSISITVSDQIRQNVFYISDQSIESNPAQNPKPVETT